MCFLMLYSLSCPIVVKGLAYLLEKDFLDDDPPRAAGVDVVVVLGGGVARWGDGLQSGPSGETASRFLYGLKVLKQSGAKFIVFSGSVDEGTSEAKIMAGLAKQLGVDQSKIIVEQRSRNTWEHGIEVNRLLKDKTLRIGVVTSAMHMRRSLTAFGKYFPNTVALPSSYYYGPLEISWKPMMPNVENLLTCAKLLHEVIGLVWYGLQTQTMGAVR